MPLLRRTLGLRRTMGLPWRLWMARSPPRRRRPPRPWGDQRDRARYRSGGGPDRAMCSGCDCFEAGDDLDDGGVGQHRVVGEFDRGDGLVAAVDTHHVFGGRLVA